MRHWKLYTQVWKIMLQYYKKPMIIMVLLAALVIAATALSVFLPYLMKQMIDLSPFRNFEISFESIWSLQSLYVLAVIYTLAWLISNVFMHISHWLSGVFLKNIDCALVYQGLDNFFQLKYQQQSSIDIGVINTDIWRGASAFGQMTYTCLFILVPIIFEIFAMMWMLTQNINLKYALLFLLFALLTFAVTLWLSFKSKDIFSAMFEAHNQVNGFFIEKVQSYYDVQVNASKDYQLKKFAQSVEEYRHRSFASYQKMSLLMIFQVVMVGFFLFTFMLFTMYLFELRQVTAGDMILISSYIIALAMPVLQVSQSLIRLKGDVIAVRKYYDYFELPQHVLTDAAIEKNHTLFQFKHAQIQLGQHKISDFNLSIAKAKCYVIKGKTGIGKSTFIQYLLGLRQIEAGYLYYQGLDISAAFSKQIFNQVAVVSQTPMVYSGSLRHNLIHNSPHAYSDAELNQYLEIFHLNQILSQHGYHLDDDLQEVYKSFSGGEKQRISIIRALLKRPECLILDEPTAALNEQIGEALLTYILSQVETVIMISHANYALQFADEIIDFDVLLEQSLIQEAHTHSETKTTK